MEPFRQLQQGTPVPGIYRLDSRIHPDLLTTIVTAWGWRGFYLNGKSITDKQSFLAGSAAAMSFPAYAGRNWDAFEELINDLSWARAQGYVVLFDHVYRFAAAQPAELHMALTIFETAIANWQAAGVPMYLLLRHNWWWNRHLPKLRLPASQLTTQADSLAEVAVVDDPGTPQ